MMRTRRQQKKKARVSNSTYVMIDDEPTLTCITAAMAKAHRASSCGQNSGLVLIPYSGYPPPDLDSAEEVKVSVRKRNTEKKGNPIHTQKGTKVIRAKGDNNSDIEEGSDSSESSDSNIFNRVDEKSELDEPSSSEDEPEPQLVSESASASEKKAPSVRKPSKRAIETALNKVSQTLNVPAKLYHSPSKASGFRRKT